MAWRRDEYDRYLVLNMKFQVNPSKIEVFLTIWSFPMLKRNLETLLIRKRHFLTISVTNSSISIAPLLSSNCQKQLLNVRRKLNFTEVYVRNITIPNFLSINSFRNPDYRLQKKFSISIKYIIRIDVLTFSEYYVDTSNSNCKNDL